MESNNNNNFTNEEIFTAKGLARLFCEGEEVPPYVFDAAEFNIADLIYYCGSATEKICRSIEYAMRNSETFQDKVHRYIDNHKWNPVYVNIFTKVSDSRLRETLNIKCRDCEYLWPKELIDKYTSTYEQMADEGVYSDNESLPDLESD